MGVRNKMEPSYDIHVEGKEKSDLPIFPSFLSITQENINTPLGRPTPMALLLRFLTLENGKRKKWLHPQLHL